MMFIKYLQHGFYHTLYADCILLDGIRREMQGPSHYEQQDSEVCPQQAHQLRIELRISMDGIPFELLLSSFQSFHSTV